MVQLEPGAAPIAAGVTADAIFQNGSNSVFATLANASAALRGTGNPAIDQATILSSLDSLTTFSSQASSARAQLGASLTGVEDATTRLSAESLSFQEAADRLESADLAQSSIELVQAQNALQATLQATALTGKGSLMDFIG
jgi:flagellin-like hook-associated protein FlgL